MEEVEYKPNVDTSNLWKQIGAVHASIANDGHLVGFAAYIVHLLEQLKVGTIKITLEPKVSTLGTGDDVCVGEFRLSGDLDAFRAAVKASEVNKWLVHKPPVPDL